MMRGRGARTSLYSFLINIGYLISVLRRSRSGSCFFVANMSDVGRNFTFDVENYLSYISMKEQINEYLY